MGSHNRPWKILLVRRKLTIKKFQILFAVYSTAPFAESDCKLNPTA